MNQNAYIESFNGRLREECLNEHRFTSLAQRASGDRDVGRVYNEERPKKGLGWAELHTPIGRAAGPATQLR
jgi:putative transposase